MSVIHRCGMSGGAQCGAGPDRFGHLKISTSGVVVTCPACKPAKVSREDAAAALRSMNSGKAND